MPPVFLLAVKVAFLVILYLFVARAVRAVTLDVFGPRAERRRARPARAPTRPVLRAYPSAMKPPPCSCRGRMVRMCFSKRVRAWCSGMLAPPG